jgi:hypothetical protein
MLRIAACLAWKEDGARADRCTQGVLVALAEAFDGDGEDSLPPELDFLRQAQREKAPDGLGAKFYGALPENPADRFVSEAVAFRPIPEQVRLSIHSKKKLEIWPIQNFSIQVESQFTYRQDSPSRKRLNLIMLKPGFEPYRESTQQQLLQLFGLENALRRLPDQHGPEIRIELEMPLAWICWEALLTLAGSSHPSRLLSFRRTLTQAARKERPLSGPVRLLSFGPTLADLEMSLQGWEPLRHDTRFRSESLESDALLDRAGWEDDPVQVLHVIGRPIGTTAGARLEISEASVGRTVGRGQVLAPRDLLHRLPQARLLILQAKTRRTSKRSGSDREKTAYLRLMAAELHGGGIPAVLVIPPLSQDLGTAVLREIANALREPAASLTEPLLRALAMARLRIRENSSSLSDEDRLEQVLDLTFYGQDIINWKLPTERL